MPFCPHCGNETDQLIAALNPVKEEVSAEVEIARINAERDVKVAQLAARGDKDWNETQVEVAEIEADAGMVEAETKAELLDEIMAPEPDPEPVVVVSDETSDEGPADTMADSEPPEADPVSIPEKSGNPWW